MKDGAYAWRQAIFFLSVAGPTAAEAVLTDESIGASGPAVMAELLDGLRRSAVSQAPDDNHSPFVGWTVGRHWILDAIGHPSTALP